MNNSTISSDNDSALEILVPLEPQRDSQYVSQSQVNQDPTSTTNISRTLLPESTQIQEPIRNDNLENANLDFQVKLNGDEMQNSSVGQNMEKTLPENMNDSDIGWFGFWLFCFFSWQLIAIAICSYHNLPKFIIKKIGTLGTQTNKAKMIFSKLSSRKLSYNFSKHIINLPKKPKIHTLSHLGYKNDPRFGVSEPFPLFTQESVSYLQNLLEDEKFLEKTKQVMPFAPFCCRDPGRNDSFLREMMEDEELLEYLSGIVGEEVEWHWNPWNASNINVQEDFDRFEKKEDLHVDEKQDENDIQVFDWHLDSQPYTLVVNFSNFPTTYQPKGGSTLIRKMDNTGVLEMKHQKSGYATLFRGCSVFHKATSANYKRMTFVTTLSHKNVAKLDCDDMLWASEHGDSVRQSEEYLEGRLDRILKQFYHVKSRPEDIDKILETVEREMVVMRQFKDTIFKMHAGQEYDLGLIGSSYGSDSAMEEALSKVENKMF